MRCGEKELRCGAVAVVAVAGVVIRKIRHCRRLSGVVLHDVLHVGAHSYRLESFATEKVTQEFHGPLCEAVLRLVSVALNRDLERQTALGSGHPRQPEHRSLF